MIYHATTKITAGALILATSSLSFAKEETFDDAYELDPVVVTGTRTERIISETPVKTELLLKDDLQSYNLTSLKDALKLVPTARFESDCQNCGLNQIQLLGLSTDYTSFLFDGSPLYCGLAKVYGADLFPAVFVDRLEVVKGGSSSLYGPEAIAGVVNLITTEPNESSFLTSLSIESILGDATETEASFSYDSVDPSGAFSYTVYGMRQDRDSLDLTTDGFSEIPEFENTVIGFQTWYRPSETGQLKLSYQYMDQSHRGGDNLDLPEEQARVAESLAHEINIASAEWAQTLASDIDYTLKASYIDVQRHSYYGARADLEQRAYEEAGYEGDVTEAYISANQNAIDALARTVWGNSNNDVFYIDSQVNWRKDRHTFSTGLQYRLETLSDGPLYGAASSYTEDDFSNTSFFLQDQWLIGEKSELVMGGRIDDHDNVDGTVFSPRIAYRHTQNKNMTYRASWSTGFNAPGAFNEDQHIGVNNGGAILLQNDPDLKEESSQTFSLGAEWRPKNLEDKIILHSQLHYTLLKDSFDIDDSGELSGDENIWLRVNGAESSVFVWENNTNWQINEAFKLDAGISYVRALYDEPVERVTGLTTREYLKRPDWTGHIALSYENHEFVDANLLMSYTGSMVAVGEDADIWRDTPKFLVMDFGLSKEFEGFLGDSELILSAGVNNIFDQRQKDQQDNGEERDPTYLYGPVNPRSVYLTARVLW
ncbi:TonB-dependent receptor plug domain-containing protein [Pelagicoccus albus]|uniref:TonB-dependent receptor n=1 Tax=Pelagicoccus albus TaxID=415222 RepID=A0A7X1B949_9BACT|nr:TonB-dependent receptor [Pelagicoccus albus]MBC2607846.1 TonB-dependent receptor [Pelagicoccus albus]